MTESQLCMHVPPIVWERSSPVFSAGINLPSAVFGQPTVFGGSFGKVTSPCLNKLRMVC